MIPSTVPTSLFQSKALFNPYQYRPFLEIMTHETINGYDWNGRDLLITDEVGVGKTFETGIILKELLKKREHLTVLLICPSKLCYNWQEEMEENFYLHFRHGKHQGFGQLSILPYSYFSENPEVWDSSAIPPFDVLILDEAHYIRNENNCYLNIKNLLKVTQENQGVLPNILKIFLTATPVFNHSTDYDNITSLLRDNFASTRTLQGEANCYDYTLDISSCEVSLQDIELDIMEDIYSMVEELDDEGDEVERCKYGHLTGYLKRISASSIHSLGEFLHHYDPENNAKLYRDEVDSQKSKEEEDCFQDLEEQWQKLQYLTSLVDKWAEGEDSKLKVLLSTLADIKKDQSAKGIVIFSCFHATCHYVRQALEKTQEDSKFFEITGKDSQQQVERIKTEFKKVVDQGKNAFLICSDAAKEGHNFQFCQHLIHYDFPYTPAGIGQRNGRIYRKGQEGKPKVYYITSNGTYDDRLFGEIIVEKCNVVKKLSDSGKISVLNILPRDMDDYLKNCLKKYFEDNVLKRTYSKFPEHQGKNHPKEEFKYQLRRAFSYMKAQERVWTVAEMKELYNSSEEMNKEFYLHHFVEIFSKNGETEKTLHETYLDAYDSQMEQVNKAFFPDGQKSLLANMEEVLQGATGLYCTYFMKEDEIRKNSEENEEETSQAPVTTKEKITISQYKKMFKPYE